MKSLWLQIPRTLRVSLIVSFFLLIASIIASGFVKNFTFGLQTGICGGFSVALLCAYVVWTSRVLASARTEMATSEKKEAVATSAATKLQLGSLVKFLVLSAILIVLVAVFKLSPVAAIIGVSDIYLPLAIVPLFVKSAPVQDEKKPESDTSEVKEQC